MLKSESMHINNNNNNEIENKPTETVNSKKQILFFQFDDSSNQQVLPNYL